MSKGVLDRIRLISIEDAQLPGQRAAWIVTLGFFDGRGHLALSANWEFAKADYDEANIVRLARHYFHRLTGGLSRDTAQWELSEAELVAIKPTPKPLSQSTA